MPKQMLSFRGAAGDEEPAFSFGSMHKKQIPHPPPRIRDDIQRKHAKE
jgi:hypothetical protein